MLSPTFAVNTGYTVTMNLRKLEDDIMMGPSGTNRFLQLYVNGVAQTDSLTIKTDFGAVSDFVNSPRDHYLIVGDFVSSALNRYNYVHVIPNPKNVIKDALSAEKTFDETKAFIFIQDFLVYENTMVTFESELIPSNCLLGVHDISKCIFCKAGYSLDTTF